MAFYVIKGRKEVLLQYCLRIHHTWALCFCRLISQITENFSPLYVISTFLSKRRALTFLPCFLLIGTQQCIGKRECKHPGRFGLLWTLEPAIQILFESLSLRLKAFTLSSGPKEREPRAGHTHVFLHYLKLLLLLLLCLIAYSDTKQPSKDIFKDIYGHWNGPNFLEPLLPPNSEE